MLGIDAVFCTVYQQSAHCGGSSCFAATVVYGALLEWMHRDGKTLLSLVYLSLLLGNKGENRNSSISVFC